MPRVRTNLDQVRTIRIQTICDKAMAKPKDKTSTTSEEPADASLLEESMGYLVRRTFRAFTHALEIRLSRHDVTISMWFFLRLLWEGDGRTQKELAEELGLSQPTTVSAMDTLEKRGLIRRVRNTDDRRKVNIHLTRSGKQLKSKLIGYAEEVNAVALAGMSPKDVAQARKLLLAMNRALAK